MTAEVRRQLLIAGEECVCTVLVSNQSGKNEKEKYTSEKNTEEKTPKNNEIDINSSNDDENDVVPVETIIKYLQQVDIRTQN